MFGANLFDDREALTMSFLDFLRQGSPAHTVKPTRSLKSILIVTLSRKNEHMTAFQQVVADAEAHSINEGYTVKPHPIKRRGNIYDCAVISWENLDVD
jgi:hypothetical protein